MNLALTGLNEVQKQVFSLKNTSKNGKILRIHHTVKDLQTIRFIHCCFSPLGQILACSDNAGNVFVIDLSLQKFWNLPNLSSCTVLKFSTYNPNDLLIGVISGVVILVDIQLGISTGRLIGHKHPVRDISFSHDFQCLTSSRCEAIIWDLPTNTKMQVLTLGAGCIAKYVTFMPVTSNILACFKDNLIHVWKNNTYETYNQILPNAWNNFIIRSIAFTKNGRDMVFAGHSSQLAVFQLQRWQLSHLITLPQYVLSVKHLEFIPQSFDGGYNRLLAILSGQGVIYFYDVDRNQIISELVSHSEITRFHCAEKGNFIACCLCNGEVEVYDIIQYIVQPVQIQAKAVEADGKIRMRKCGSKLGFVKREICDMLHIEKLRDILREYSEYPDSYRIKIWEHLLDLPNNRDLYNAIINHVTLLSFEDLYKKYPLENKMNIRNLKKLLNNLVTWCPFFSHVEYLPVFCFPFVKLFSNKPIACFEAVCTILLNWCQYWFEYFPLPPINILSMIENILLEHDSELLEHFAKYNVTSREYAWPMLETAFSEVLTSSQWLCFWDHVLTNEPAFLLCATVSYCIVQKTTILTFKNLNQIHNIFHMQNPLDMKKFITKTYSIMEITSEAIHPRQYLNMFTKIEFGQYPKFMDYPKAIIDYQTTEMEHIKREDQRLEQEQVRFSNKSKLDEKFMHDLELEEVEKQRIFEMEKALKQKLLEEQEKVKNRQQKLVRLKDELQQKEAEILKHSKQKMEMYKNNQRKRVLESLMVDLKLGSSIENFKANKAEQDLCKHYNELLKHRHKIELMLSLKSTIPEATTEEQELINLKAKLDEEISQAHKLALGQDHLKQMNIATGLKAVDELIQRVESELVREQCDPKIDDKEINNLRVTALKEESIQLEKEVAKLMKLLADARLQRNELLNKRNSLTLPHSPQTGNNDNKVIEKSSQDRRAEKQRSSDLSHDSQTMNNAIIHTNLETIAEEENPEPSDTNKHYPSPR